MRSVIAGIIFLIPFLAVSGTEMDSLFRLSNELYMEGKYEDALMAYEKLEEEGYRSPVLYYNLGNAYFKTNRLAPAIWSYEKALLLDPGNEDIRYNIELVNTRLKDKINALPSIFLKRWFENLVASGGSNFWAIAGGLIFILMLVLLFYYFRSHSYLTKRSSFFAALLCFVIMILFIAFSFFQKRMLTDNPYAILYEPVVNVKSAPSATSTDLFVLHEGMKVEVLNEVHSYSQIRIPNGNRGWIPTEHLKMLSF